MAQGASQRQAQEPWLEGKFPEAEHNFAQIRKAFPGLPDEFVWEAEFEIERARFGQAATLLDAAKRNGMWASHELPERWEARLFLAAGSFSRAQKAALEGHRWDGRNLKKLRVQWVMDLVTLGEVALAKGDFATAISVFERARSRLRASYSSNPDWVRATNGIAVADIALGSTAEASQVSAMAVAVAEARWGPGGIPAVDSLDVLGQVQTSSGDFKNAEVSLDRSRSRREELYGVSHPKVADSDVHAALLRAAQGQLDDAIPLLERGFGIQKAISAGPSGRWALALLVGAEIYGKAGRISDASACYESAIPILENELGPDAPRVVAARKQYEKLRNK